MIFVRPADKSEYWKTIFFISHPKHVVGTQKNHFNETVLLSTQNTCFNNHNFTLKISLSASVFSSFWWLLFGFL